MTDDLRDRIARAIYEEHTGDSLDEGCEVWPLHDDLADAVLAVLTESERVVSESTNGDTAATSPDDDTAPPQVWEEPQDCACHGPTKTNDEPDHAWGPSCTWERGYKDGRAAAEWFREQTAPTVTPDDERWPSEDGMADLATDLLDALHFEPSTRDAEMDAVMDVLRKGRDQ